MAKGTTKPIFLGQSLLLLALVVLLLTVGFNSLRLDRIQAHREAANRAQQIADLLATQMATALNITNTAQIPDGSLAFVVDRFGEVVFPSSMLPKLNPKPLTPSRLSPQQALAWKEAQAAERQGQTAAALKAYKRALALQPPAEFQANWNYSLALLLSQAGNPTAARDQLTMILKDQPEATTESGLPLEALVRLKLLELNDDSSSDRTAAIDLLCSNIVTRPTPMTAAFLREARGRAVTPAERNIVESWNKAWAKDEQPRRELYAAVASGLRITRLGDKTSQSASHAGSPNSAGPPPAFWFGLGPPLSPEDGGAFGAPGTKEPRRWLAVPSTGTSNSANGVGFVCWPENHVLARANSILNQAEKISYFGRELQIAGRTLTVGGGPAADRTEGRPELLASAMAGGGSLDWVRANVYLTRPGLVYEQQRSRRFWFGSLLALCALLASVALFANWRAWQRQQKLSELKSDFVSSVSHELRTPLASVRLLLEGLETGRVSGPAKQKEYLRLMSQECRRLSALIENILDYSRIEHGRKHLQFKPMDLRGVVDQSIKLIEPYAAERKVSVVLEHHWAAKAGSMPQMHADGMAIQQALLNLIDNAVKHSPEGETVVVGLELRDGQRDDLQIWVEDRGPGIPAEEHGKIFERFYRRGSELRRETQGIGIGLTIVKHIVEAHGGRVLVRSKVGQGSRFTIELPLNRENVSHGEGERTHSIG